MNEMDRQRYEDLKEAYALNALSEEERRWFEAYLARHPELRREVEELCSLSALLSLAPEEQEPPEDLRRRVLAAVAAEAPHPGEERPPASERLRAMLGGRAPLLAAAVLLVGLLSWNVFLQAELGELRQDNQALREQAAREEGPREISLRATDGMRGVEAKVVYLEDDRAVLVAENMPPAPEGKTMQIWVMKNGEPLPAGLFRPEGGSAAAMIERPLEGAEAVAITVEPAGGSPHPTSDPVMTARV
ncbi:hypothetical protein RxyAA322_10040 [Rubrobacter xylanophilus]|uniref:Regulator of SigK n=2 Tax=Rubrobacter xylanophilus TaxID=49319 RepID=A0A510HGR6_9ACTN|nr:hypothetical protein RxyAA322_10040 [Rubrobacter xylanophilus]